MCVLCCCVVGLLCRRRKLQWMMSNFIYSDLVGCACLAYVSNSVAYEYASDCMAHAHVFEAQGHAIVHRDMYSPVSFTPENTLSPVVRLCQVRIQTIVLTVERAEAVAVAGTATSGVRQGWLRPYGPHPSGVRRSASDKATIYDERCVSYAATS